MDEKKKLMILIALVAVIGCIGAFQMLGKSAPHPPPPPPVATTTAAATTPKADAKASKAPVIKNPLVANELPSRDPFAMPFDERQRPAPPVNPSPAPRPFPSVSKFPPMKPLAPSGGFDGTGLATVPSGPSQSPTMAEAPKPFGYQVVGAIHGDRSAVILQDSAGNQKLVPEGAAIDGDSRVRRVENGAVTIVYRGKLLRLTVGGISVDKK